MMLVTCANCGYEYNLDNLTDQERHDIEFCDHDTTVKPHRRYIDWKQEQAKKNAPQYVEGVGWVVYLGEH